MLLVAPYEIFRAAPPPTIDRRGGTTYRRLPLARNRALDGLWAETEVGGDAAVVDYRGGQGEAEALGAKVIDELTARSLLGEPRLKPLRLEDGRTIFEQRLLPVGRLPLWTPTREIIRPHNSGPNGTAVLEPATGASENPIATNWSGPVFSGGPQLQRVTGSPGYITAGTGSGSENDASYWDIETFGADCEAFASFIVDPESPDDIFVRLASPGTTGVDGYSIHSWYIPTTWRKYRWDNGSRTQLGSDLTATGFGAGDDMAIEMIGSTLTPYRDVGAGWVSMTASTDATYGAAGYIGMLISYADCQWRDFGGGTVGGAPAALQFDTGMMMGL